MTNFCRFKNGSARISIKFFSTGKENTKSSASSCCLLIISEINRINYGEHWRVLVNSDYTCHPRFALCSALMNTFATTSMHVIVILRNVCLAIFCEPNGSLYTFAPYDANCSGLPHCNGRPTVSKFGNPTALETFSCSLANRILCESFDIIPAECSNLYQDIIIQKQIFHKERFSRARFKVFPKSLYKRNREGTENHPEFQ